MRWGGVGGEVSGGVCGDAEVGTKMFLVGI